MFMGCMIVAGYLQIISHPIPYVTYVLLLPHTCNSYRIQKKLFKTWDALLFPCQRTVSEWGQTASGTLSQEPEAAILRDHTEGGRSCIKRWFVSTSKGSICYTTLKEQSGREKNSRLSCNRRTVRYKRWAVSPSHPQQFARPSSVRVPPTGGDRWERGHNISLPVNSRQDGRSCAMSNRYELQGVWEALEIICIHLFIYVSLRSGE